MTENFPTLTELLGNEHSRLKGILGWDDVPLLGSGNIENVLHFARGNVQQVFNEGETLEAKELSKGIKRLEDYATKIVKYKPLLPRLRIESFRKGNKVKIYMGDTEGVRHKDPWINAVIIDIKKAQKPDFVDGSWMGGYYWRITAKSDKEFFPNEFVLPFSTSEPRVILAKDFEYLQNAFENDIRFLNIYCQNANRECNPIWCMERKIESSGSGMDMRVWLQR